MYMFKENGKQVLYVELQKNLDRTLQAAIQFWKDLTKFLTEELGFIINPYDSCVINKIINGTQCTIIWHVNDLKLSHIKQSVLEDIANKLNLKYGQVTPLVIHHGKTHCYLGMTIDYPEDGKVKFVMCNYMEGILDGAPPEMDGLAITPAASSLFSVRKDTKKLDDEHTETYHHINVQLLYLCQCARPDLQPTMAFLSTTRIMQPDIDDWKKLTCSVWYLHDSKELYLTLEADSGIDIKWWIDASFAVHPDMKSHKSRTMSFRKGSVYSISWKQHINTKS